MKRYKVKERLKTKIVKERRRRKIVLAVTGILGILAVCGLLFRKVSHTLMTSKFFEVKTTDITGACITEPELIRQYLNFNGKNIFCLELGKSRNLVINRFSSIKTRT